MSSACLITSGYASDRDDFLRGLNLKKMFLSDSRSSMTTLSFDDLSLEDKLKKRHTIVSNVKKGFRISDKNHVSMVNEISKLDDDIVNSILNTTKKMDLVSNLINNTTNGSFEISSKITEQFLPHWVTNKFYFYQILLPNGESYYRLYTKDNWMTFRSANDSKQISDYSLGVVPCNDKYDPNNFDSSIRDAFILDKHGNLIQEEGYFFDMDIPEDSGVYSNSFLGLEDVATLYFLHHYFFDEDRKNMVLHEMCCFNEYDLKQKNTENNIPHYLLERAGGFNKLKKEKALFLSKNSMTQRAFEQDNQFSAGTSSSLLPYLYLYKEFIELLKQQINQPLLSLEDKSVLDTIQEQEEILDKKISRAEDSLFVYYKAEEEKKQVAPLPVKHEKKSAQKKPIKKTGVKELIEKKDEAVKSEAALDEALLEKIKNKFRNICYDKTRHSAKETKLILSQLVSELSTHIQNSKTSSAKQTGSHGGEKIVDGEGSLRAYTLANRPQKEGYFNSAVYNMVEQCVRNAAQKYSSVQITTTQVAASSSNTSSSKKVTKKNKKR